MCVPSPNEIRKSVFGVITHTNQHVCRRRDGREASISQLSSGDTINKDAELCFTWVEVLPGHC